MDAFQLSPGITPLLADVVLVEFVLLLAILYRARGADGFEAAVALNALALGAIKLGTDYADLLDDPVALAGIIGGSLYLWGLRTPRSLRPAPGKGTLVVAAVVGLLGVLKLYLDFYDPFDLLLALLAIVLALWWFASVRRRSRDPAVAI